MPPRHSETEDNNGKSSRTALVALILGFATIASLAFGAGREFATYGIKDKLAVLQVDITTIKKEMGDNVKSIQSDVGDIKTDLASIKTTVADTKVRVDNHLDGRSGK
jgi:hypothetical protein